MKDTLLLIGGSPRSGTTAILQILNSSPAVFITSEENLLKSLKSLEGLLGTRGRRAKALVNGMRELSPRETLTLDNIHSHNFDGASVWPTLRHIYALHHAALHGETPLQVWGDKLPAYAREIDAVLALPDARYLHITRHPFDVINSMLRRLEATRKGLDWWKGITEFDAMVEAWASAYEAVESVEGSPRVFHLQYEQLVFDFEANALALNRFLGVDLSYQNILVSDPALHFDRSQLTPELQRRIEEHPAVQRYVARYRDDASMPHVQRAIRWSDDAQVESPRAPLASAQQGVAGDVPDHGPAGQPIRVFIACTPAEWLPMRVLEFSIREHTTRPVEAAALYQFNRPIPVPADVRNRPRTPFSFQRFLIPELCGHAGRAIYLDADMQVFSDIGALWDHPMEDCDLLTVDATTGQRRPQFSVMLLDCAALRWNIESIVADLDAGRLDYDALMFEMKVARRLGRRLPSTWNSLEHYQPNETHLLHYTDMTTQPWVSCSNPNAEVWVAALRRAIHCGFLSRHDLAREIDAGHVRPSLQTQIDMGVDDPRGLTRAQTACDDAFKPPYRALEAARGGLWSEPRAAVGSLLRGLGLR